MFLTDANLAPSSMIHIATQTQTLAERLAEGRLPLAEALRCATQLGEALRRSHDAGQYHGAVTPANIRRMPNTRNQVG